MRQRAVRLVEETSPNHESEWSAISAVANKVGCAPATLHAWVRRAQRDTGKRPGVTTAERYIHHARAHSRPIPIEVLRAADGITDPDQRHHRDAVRGFGFTLDEKRAKSCGRNRVKQVNLRSYVVGGTGIEPATRCL